jgi:hypothetical protein
MINNSETAFIYKYLPSDRESYFSDQLLRFTQPQDLNDPFECIPAQPSIDEVKDLIERVFKIRVEEIHRMKKITKASRKELLNENEITKKREITKLTKSQDNLRSHFLSQGKENINKHIGVFSLSRRWNSTLMWSHYCNSHKGFCIGFDKNNEFFTSGKLAGHPPVPLKSVVYSDSRVQVPLERNQVISFDVMYTKSKDWAYEEEERLLAMLKFANKTIKSNPSDICLFEVPHNLIKEIIIGANASTDLINKITTFGKSINSKVYLSMISEKEFDMTRKLL